jgi:signal transduction histidine kinase
VHASVLRDDLAKLLRAIGRALRQPVDGGVHQAPAVQHGEQRWETGWSLSEVVRDYQLVRLVVVDFLEQMLARPLYSREAMAIGVFIDDAIAASVAAYVRNRDDEALRSEQQRVRSLEEANRRKDEFLAVLGHELRNPLAPIVTSVRVLRSLLDGAQTAVKQSIDVIERQASQLSRLVDDMLDLARIGQGRFELRKMNVSVRHMLEQAADAAHAVMHARGHRLVVSLPDPSVAIDADPDRLLQVIANLLNNAAKYTEPGGEVSLAAEAAGQEVAIRVRDTGMGIPADMVAHVFDLFAQVHGSEKYSQGGLGIGLTLARRLVEQHGGTIVCHSAGPGQGSEFVIRLPIVSATASRPGEPSEPGVSGIRIVGYREHPEQA